jgi:cyclic pyranopterin phosphate synthase
VLKDSYGRQIKDLRISVTDRCNFKCFYCKTATGVNYVARERLLTYEEIVRLSRIFVSMGVSKIRVTGGEPLLRKNLETLVEELSRIEGLHDLALTTNGFNFYRHAPALKSAGLKRVTISLDSLVRGRFQQMTGQDDLAQVLQSIRVAREVGFQPVKVNCVTVRGWNDDEIPDFAELARREEIGVRFIEFMPLDEDEKWTIEQVVSGREIVGILSRHFDLQPIASLNPSETSVNFAFRDGPGSVGVIATVSQAFCGECSRIRLTADGKLRTCLFSLQEYDVKALLRSGAKDGEIARFIEKTVEKKEQGHQINQPGFVPPPRSMSYIGG